VENMKNVTDLTKALFALSKVDDIQRPG
jgi:hypothetical protein